MTPHATSGPVPIDPVEVRSFGPDGPIGGGGWIDRENPARIDELVGRAEAVAVGAVDGVARGAHDAHRDWARLGIDDRCALLGAAADSVAATAPELGRLLARELGKPVADCRGEMLFAAACLRWCIEAAPRVAADSEVDDEDGRLLVTRIPYGVTVAVVPWNAPLILSILKVAPSLVCGNAIVVKPSPIAPLAVTLALGAIAAALPPGVLSVVHGDASVASALVAHELVRKVAFTGGGATARHVLASAATTIKPVLLELGGNDAALFLDDADLGDAAMERAVFGTFLTSGQVCMAAKRLYVPAARLEEFVDGYLRAADRVLVLGDPLDEEVTVGPMATDTQRRFVVDLCADAVERGAEAHELGTVATGTELERGWFLRPVLLTGCDDGDRLVVEEQFGPAVPVLTYDDLDDAVSRVNNSELGLASSVWSGDEDRAIAVGRRLEAGMTFVNCHNRAGMSLRAPFGGVKQSGFGREFGEAGIAEYLQTHAIHVPSAVRDGASDAGGGGRSYPGT